MEDIMIPEKVFSKEQFPQFSERMITDHLELYKRYVKLGNEMLNSPIYYSGEGNATYSQFSEWHKKYSTVLNAIKLHEEFFNCVGTIAIDTMKETSDEAKSQCLQMIEGTFGKFETFKNLLLEMMKSTNGWVILGVDVRTSGVEGVLHLNVVEGHDKFGILGFEPCLTLDAWEHAYMVDYGLDKEKYFEACMENLNWKYILWNFRISGVLNVKNNPE